MIKDISDLATSLWEIPSSRVSGIEETPIPERQAVTELTYPINNVSVETPHTAISNLLSSVPEPLHPPHQDNTEPHSIAISNPPPPVSKPLHPPHQPDTETLSITISNPLSKVFAPLIPMTPGDQFDRFRKVTSSRVSVGEEVPLAHRLYRSPVTDQEEIIPQEVELVAPGRTRPSTSPP